MLPILLLALKVIGIILLILFGLVLAALLLLLLVPLRYRAYGRWAEERRGEVKFSWLLHLLTGAVSYDGGEAILTVRALGFVLTKRRVWPEEEDTRREEDAAGAGTPGEAEEPFGDAEEPSGPQPDFGSAGESGFDPDLETVEITEIRPGGEAKEPEEPAPSYGFREPEEPAPSHEFRESSKSRPECDDGGEDKALRMAELTGGASGGNPLAALWGRITRALENLAPAFRRFCGKLRGAGKSLQEVQAFVEDEENRRTFRLLLSQTKKLLRHLLPRKVRGWLRFGFSDPYRTGQALAAVSPFYGLYAAGVALEPVFGESVLQGELRLKGHIRPGALLFIVLRVLMNKNFRVLLKRWMR